jgi:hypothetical protein
MTTAYVRVYYFPYSPGTYHSSRRCAICGKLCFAINTAARRSPRQYNIVFDSNFVQFYPCLCVAYALWSPRPVEYTDKGRPGPGKGQRRNLPGALKGPQTVIGPPSFPGPSRRSWPRGRYEGTHLYG